MTYILFLLADDGMVMVSGCSIDQIVRLIDTQIELDDAYIQQIKNELASLRPTEEVGIDAVVSGQTRRIAKVARQLPVSAPSFAYVN